MRVLWDALTLVLKPLIENSKRLISKVKGAYFLSSEKCFRI